MMIYRVKEYSMPGFEPGTKRLVRASLYPTELHSHYKYTTILNIRKLFYSLFIWCNRIKIWYRLQDCTFIGMKAMSSTFWLSNVFSIKDRILKKILVFWEKSKI